MYYLSQEFIDIPRLVEDFRLSLERYGVSQRFAARFIMHDTSQGNLSFLMEKGKTKSWSDISVKGRIPYIKMKAWLSSKEQQLMTLEMIKQSQGNPNELHVLHYLPLDGILQILIYLLWECSVQNRTTFLCKTLYFEIQTLINVNLIERYLVRFIQQSSASKYVMHRSFIKIDPNVLIMAIFSIAIFPKAGENCASYTCITGRIFKEHDLCKNIDMYNYC